MLNSQLLEIFKNEIDITLTEIINDSFSVDDNIDVLLDTSNLNSKTGENIRDIGLIIKDDASLLVSNCEKIRENTEKLLSRRLAAERFANDALEQFDIFYYGGNKK